MFKIVTPTQTPPTTVFVSTNTDQISASTIKYDSTTSSAATLIKSSGVLLLIILLIN